MGLSAWNELPAVFVFASALLFLIFAQQLHTNLEPNWWTQNNAIQYLSHWWVALHTNVTKGARNKTAGESTQIMSTGWMNLHLGLGCIFMTCLCWDQAFCFTSVTEEPRRRAWHYVLREPTDLNSVAQSPTAALNTSSGKSAGFRTRLKTKSSPPSNSAHLHLNSNRCKNQI